MPDVGQAVTTAFDGFDPVVQALDKAAAETFDKVISDFIAPLIQCFQETVEAT